MSGVPLTELLAALRAGRGFAHKRDIAAVLGRLAPTGTDTTVPNGDDCAVLPDPQGRGQLLLAIEGLMPDFVASSPWFAGYSGVLVNLSDIAAMGGRPLAVVDALWSGDAAHAAEVLAGLRAAAERYGVPLVGGHSNLRAPSAQLAVAILGRAEKLVSSFAARSGDRLLVAVDLRGAWQGDAPFWNASTEAPPERLRADLALLPALAEDGLCDAGKDISMAGVLGTLLMLLECSRVGARVALDRLPAPAGAEPLRWLQAFPSYGYVLSVRPALADAVRVRFAARGIACADIGAVEAGTRLVVERADESATLWDLAEAPFIGAAGHG